MTISKEIEKIYRGLKKEIAIYSIKPKLSVILVGKNLNSEIYIKKKEEVCRKLGISFQLFRLSENSKEITLLNLIKQLNKNHDVQGILVQLPLPEHFNVELIMASISPEKDVDGLNPLNIGRLFFGNEALASCVARGVMRVLEQTNINVKGKNVVIVNNSNLIGKPLALMFINRNATVDVCCKETKNLKIHTKKADILITATSSPKLIKKNMIKKGVVIIDIGMGKLNGKICGDVDFKDVKDKSSFLTPVPSGIGPMTVAMLMENMICCYKKFLEKKEL